MKKITRVRTGCWTCKKRRRKCDEAKPFCNMCLSMNRKCEGYQRRLTFQYEMLTQKEGGIPKKTPAEVVSSAQPILVIKSGPSMVCEGSLNSSTTSNLDSNVKTPQIISTVDFVRKVKCDGSNKGNEHDEAEKSQSTDGNAGFGNMANSPLSRALSDLFSSLRNNGYNSGILPQLSLDDLLSALMEEIPANANTGTQSNFNTELLHLIGKTNVFDDGKSPANTRESLAISYNEENRMLRHFFQNLLPLLDAHPQSPWPKLALQYCDFDVARSCFISLACIHIYESRKGGNEYYDKGMAHIHRTMRHLIDSISSSKSAGSSPEGGATDDRNTQIQSFVILVLINVHILFAVLEKGKSSLARYLFKVFASICMENDLFQSLMQNQSKGSLVVVLSWYDTVSAMVSPDCRLPYCSPEWYGTSLDAISTLQMMGCPGEIFRALSEVCFLRHEIQKGNINDDMDFAEVLETVKTQLLNYRDYVDFNDGLEYSLRLKGAQCWSLAVYISLLRLFKTSERAMVIRAAVNEFIEIYGSMPSNCPIVTQMVWPVYAVGCECVSEDERKKMLCFMDTLYETAQMGTLGSLRWVVKQVWKRGKTQEEVLLEWLETGVDYLPL